MSRAPVASFHVGNIQKDTLSFTDVLIGQEESRVSLSFRDRFHDEGWRTQIAYNVGSGVDVTLDSSLLGRPTVAAKVAQTIAKRGADGIRTYQFGTTLRHADIEEGDLVTLYHPLINTSASPPHLVEVEAVRRGRGLLNFSVRDISSRLFQFGNLPIDTGPNNVDGLCPHLTQFISPFSWGAVVSGTNDVMVVSHTLGVVPTGVTHKWAVWTWNTLYPFTIDTLSADYNTTSTVALRLTLPIGQTFAGGVMGSVFDQGYNLVADHSCPPDITPP
jgi:hypothetical protein